MTRAQGAAVDLTAHAARLAPHMAVLRPEGSGPFPVVVLMHGCGGVQPLHARYAEAACEAGVAAVIVDSLAPRGITRRAAHLTVCSGMRLRGAERALDLCAALHWLEARPWADTGRLAVAGWSHGGWAIMEALVAAGRGASPTPLVGALRLAVLIYPYASVLARTAREGWGACRPRVAACVAGRDAVVGSAGALRALERLRSDGLDVDLMSLPTATHAFDDDQASDPRTVHDPALTARAVAFYVDALRSALSPAAWKARPRGGTLRARPAARAGRPG